MHFDISIVGGGLSGASLALLLSQKLPEATIAIIESFALFDDKTNTRYSENPQSLVPSYDDRASALSLGSCRIFKSLAIFDSLQPYLSAIKKVHVSDRGHPAGTLIDANELDEFKLSSDESALGYVIENRFLGKVLLGAIQQKNNITVFSPATVTQISSKQQGASLSLNCGSKALELNTELAVIADGAHSSLRQSLGIAVDSQPYEQCAVIANITPSTPHQNIAYERFTDDGPMALLPLNDFEGQPRCALVWTIPATEEERIKNLSEPELLTILQQRFGDRLGFFQHVGQRHIYPLTLHKAKEQVRRNIILMGNAAHSMHPVAGQGFNLALRDCAVLSDTLQEANLAKQPLGDIAVLDRYFEIQQWDQDKTIGVSHLLTLLFSSGSTLPALARNTGLLGLNFLPGIKTWFAQQAAGLGGRGPVTTPANKATTESSS